jgi:hypothetical protein
MIRFTAAISTRVPDEAELIFGDLGKVMPLGKVLSDQSIGIIVQPALPRAVGMREEEGGL